jgi:hypothetical protein
MDWIKSWLSGASSLPTSHLSSSANNKNILVGLNSTNVPGFCVAYLQYFKLIIYFRLHIKVNIVMQIMECGPYFPILVQSHLLKETKCLLHSNYARLVFFRTYYYVLYYTGLLIPVLCNKGKNLRFYLGNSTLHLGM